MNSEARITRDRLFRVVVDTNVLISGLLSATGNPKRIIDGWLAGEFTLLTSDDMLEECERVLGYPKLQEGLKLATIPRDQFMAMLRTEGEGVEVTGLDLSGVVRDPFAEIVLGCALSGNADYLVSGDEDLLTLGEYAGVKIISPREFVQVLEGQNVERGGTSPLPS